MKRTVIISLLAAIIGSASTLFIASHLDIFVADQIISATSPAVPVSEVSFTNQSNTSGHLDFTQAAETSMPAVVHIKSTQNVRKRISTQRHPLEEFFWPDAQQMPRAQAPRVSTGSGVIVAVDGYVVTNNHVIDGADEIEVSLNDNRTFKAELIGADPSTDLALLKLDGTDFPYLDFGPSDQVKVGQWVLAVGNPFNLNSTVTAGIISAKGRNINILRDKYAIESFLQTDAAINPGNSGGALVNLDGQLIGINTAIASPTGSYSGYGFAVPSEIVRKVAGDLREYGIVQRGFLGVSISDVNADLAKEKKLSVSEGVYVSDVLETGAAKAAGIQKGDVITFVDGQQVKTTSQLQESVGRGRPGDSVSVKVNRDGKEKVYTVILINKSGAIGPVSKDHNAMLNDLGIEVRTIDKDERRQLGVDGGIKVTDIVSGRIHTFTDMRPGFVITRIDKTSVSTVDELLSALKDKKGGVMIEGRYPGKQGTIYYAFGM